MIIEKKLFYYLNEAIMYMRERERENRLDFKQTKSVESIIK